MKFSIEFRNGAFELSLWGTAIMAAPTAAYFEPYIKGELDLPTKAPEAKPMEISLSDHVENFIKAGGTITKPKAKRKLDLSQIEIDPSMIDLDITLD